ncbi:hypothetical protein M408DRAFT_24114 [Serendipita vermifera MAFF 305830]|uniref:Uncharacterized protein n=1 Tax=Serendipita vermifera MAFF 305830 TaxID=933852 RepID=A0A0C3B7M0_SERVB|nr:hypothetical protein M408DRAFT_24114 [Serendipita vermifera MAFF 305830]
MAANMMSHVPTEIWHEILRTAILGHKLFAIDPLEGDPSSFFQLLGNPADISYKEVALLAHDLRLVCVGWNIIVCSLLTKITSLYHHIPFGTPLKKTQFLRKISLSKVLIDQITSLFGGCTPGDQCTKRGDVPLVKINLREVFEEGPIKAEVVRDDDPEILELLLSFPQATPHLKAVTLVVHTGNAQHVRISKLTANAFSSMFSSLVYLHIKVYSHSLPEWFISLALPALRCMEVYSYPQVPSFENWDLGSLKSLLLQGPAWSRSTLAWGSFPRLLCLKCPVELLTTHPPPEAHPLQYYSFRGFETASLTEENIRTLCDVLMNRDQHRGTQGHFSWNQLMWFTRCRPSARATHGGNWISIWETILEIGPLLEAGESQFVDVYGITYTEAASREEQLMEKIHVTDTQ